VWEIAEIAARVGKPEVAERGVLHVVTQPPVQLRPTERANRTERDADVTAQAAVSLSWSRMIVDCSGYLDRITLQGQCSLCRSLAKNGKPNEALDFMERLDASQRLKPNDKAAAIASIAEGIVAAEWKPEKRSGN